MFALCFNYISRELALFSYDSLMQTCQHHIVRNHVTIRQQGLKLTIYIFQTCFISLLSSLFWNDLYFHWNFNALNWHRELKRKRITPPTQQSVCCHGSSWGNRSCTGHEMKDTSRLHTCAHTVCVRETYKFPHTHRWISYGTVYGTVEVCMLLSSIHG